MGNLHGYLTSSAQHGTAATGIVLQPKPLPSNPIVHTQVACLDSHAPAVSVFVNLTAFFDDGCEATLKAGVMPKLVALLRETDDTGLRRFGLSALRNLLNNDSGNGFASRTPHSLTHAYTRARASSHHITSQPYAAETRPQARRRRFAMVQLMLWQPT